ncbi:hypothetical protein B9Q09_00360 [Candidatus Marsarchaeota G2 archaeon ECH_B_SAG-C16]|uniref:Uncharacterized protein n=1 Tax=Candidatus Marsarchaeota G2 archaeon ECH_B_SAG-C16 TaxID=1978163 RepID=A0A2R6BGG6_9ARCH|nr:MAG: hypothetical protein B9Q09_00360 [Candidatus Marsarchaeota G2 archaeon ECH_B_SAG-C16]
MWELVLQFTDDRRNGRGRPGIGLSLGCGSGFTGDMASAMVILGREFSLWSVGRGGDTLGRLE